MANPAGIAARAVETPLLLHVEAREIIRPMRGGSQPWLLRCDDGACYVVKFRGNPQHVRVLANEMLAGLLARLIGLPAAAPAYVEVANVLADSAPRASQDHGLHSRVEPGLHFGSRFPGEPADTLAVEFLPDRFLRSVVNRKEAFLGALVFDKWTSNSDGRQMVFHRKGSRRDGRYMACLIDQGFCFNDGDWSFPDSTLRGLYPRRCVYDGVRGLESFEPFLSRIENLNEERLKACAKAVPEEWCDGEPEGPARLAEMLFIRRRKLRQALIDAKNGDSGPFPNWK